MGFGRFGVAMSGANTANNTFNNISPSPIKLRGLFFILYRLNFSSCILGSIDFLQEYSVLESVFPNPVLDYFLVPFIDYISSLH